MKINRLLPILTLTLFSIAVGAVEYNEDAVKERCATEWPDDFEMQKYCLDTTKSGFDEYISILAAGHSERLNESFSNCETEWADEWEMVAYCANTQIDGLNSISNLIEGIPTEISEQILSKCGKEWESDYSMVAYCVENQVDAWLALNN